MDAAFERPSAKALAEARSRLAGEIEAERLILDRDLYGPYSEDASFSGRFDPDIVVRAGSIADVKAVFAVANALRVPVVPRGLGSGKSGGSLPIHGGIVLSLEKMDRVKEVDRESMFAVAEPGIVTADFMARVEAEDLFYPPDPNSLKICSLGGNVACNAGGPRALKYGVTRNYVLGVEVVTPDGEVHRFGRRTIKGVTGYDLVGLMVGSEGTLGVITEITTKLIPHPRAVMTALVSFADVRTASSAITRMLDTGITPRTLELLDDFAVAAVRAKTPGRFPENAGALIILETDGVSEERAMEDLVRIAEAAKGALDVLLAQDEVQRERIWEPRRVLSMTLAETAPRKMSEDIVVPRALIPEMLERVKRVAAARGVRTASYGHAGDGNLHVNVLFDDATKEAADRAVADIMEHTVALGGTISGEHGIGLTKRPFLGLEQAEETIALQRRMKALFDPNGILNPGKIFPSGGVRE